MTKTDFFYNLGILFIKTWTIILGFEIGIWCL
jgi:hypothetical protein